MIKNGVNITGICDADQLSRIACEHIITFSHSDYIYINRRKHPLNQLISTNLAVDISNNQKLELKKQSILLMQGIKQFTLEYRDDRKRRSVITRSLPFTKTILLKTANSTYKNINLYIIDATIQMLNQEVVLAQTSYLLAFDGDGLSEVPPIIVNNNPVSSTSSKVEPPPSFEENVEVPSLDKIADKISIPEENIVIDSSKFDIEEEFL
ncbi:hypothetical protein JHL18_12915 [Clostridium sp. YIM B02505]|uniref:Uncharacterized protein n=1 Tax=Clostridium yunnanense TaxID=2800325 RepID=A0ABS1EQ30_9CLOT|nr:hypothetical protein [Clostridium yunnanense]MBK1811523.1 hypothetical protein [Clostridium yunnanense]